MYTFVVPKFGETKCKTYKDCGVHRADCRNGICACSQGDEFVSDDKTMCFRKRKHQHKHDQYFFIHVKTQAQTLARTYIHGQHRSPG